MSFELQGTERTAGYGYQFEVICARPDGIPVAPDGTRIRFELRPGAARYRGYSRSLTMSDGQLQLITGIVAGSTCQVAETVQDSALPRFDDNSGPPGDGRVTIAATPARCWDLRVATPDCRSVVNITNVYDDSVKTVPSSAPVSSLPDTTEPPTTQPDLPRQRHRRLRPRRPPRSQRHRP